MWQILNNLPPPSKFFGSAGKRRSKLGGRSVEGFSVFRRGVRPEWEDASNAGGGEWCAKCTDLATVDGWWVNIVLALAGESLGDSGDAVTGARMVDKSDGKQGHVSYRIEVWYGPGAEANAIHDRLVEVMMEGLTCERPKFTKKAHPAIVGKAPPGPKGAKGAKAEGAAAAGSTAAEEESRKVWQRQMRSIMAKVTPEKAPRLAPQLAALVAGADKEGLEMCADLIHKNALHEGLFAETYSNVCIGLDKVKGFRDAVVSRCKIKFSNRVKDVVNAGEGEDTLERKRARANVRFIVELYKRDLIAGSDIVQIAKALIKATEEGGEHAGVHVEVLCELLTTAGTTLERQLPRDVNPLMQDVKKLSAVEGLAVRHRFALEAVIEQQRNGWKPRIQKEKPLSKEEQEAQQSGRGGSNRRAG